MQLTKTAGSDFINKSFTFDAASPGGEAAFIAAVPGKRIVVTNVEISRDAAGITYIYHGNSHPEPNTRIGGGYFLANGSECKNLNNYPMKSPTTGAVNQAVRLYSPNAGNIVVTAIYHEE